MSFRGAFNTDFAGTGGGGGETVNLDSTFFTATVLDNTLYDRSGEADLIELLDGSLMIMMGAFPSGAADGSISEMVSMTSADGGQTWTTPTVLNLDLGMLADDSIRNPSLLRLSNDDILLVFLHIVDSPNDADIYYAKSTDDGATWGDATLLYSDAEYRAPANGVLYKAVSGRIFYPSNRITSGTNSNNMVANLELHYTDNEGTSWTSVDLPTISGPSDKCFEPGMFENYHDNTLTIYWRTLSGYLYASDSTNNGANWSAEYQMDFYAPNSQTKIKYVSAQEMYIAASNELSRNSATGTVVPPTDYYLNRRHLVLSAATLDVDKNIGEFTPFHILPAETDNTGWIQSAAFIQKGNGLIVTYMYGTGGVDPTAPTNYQTRLLNIPVYSIPVQNLMQKRNLVVSRGLMIDTTTGDTQTLPSGFTYVGLNDELVYFDANGTMQGLTLGTNLTLTSGTLNAAGGSSNGIFDATNEGATAAIDAFTVTTNGFSLKGNGSNQVFSIENEGANNHTRFSFRNSSPTTTRRNLFEAYRSLGSVASPTDVGASQTLFTVAAYPYLNGAYRSPLSLEFKTGSTASASSYHGVIDFSTTAANSTAARSARITIDGADIIFNDHGAGSKTGTEAYNIAVASDGTILDAPYIETLSDLTDIPAEPTGGTSYSVLEYDDNGDTFSWVANSGREKHAHISVYGNTTDATTGTGTEMYTVPAAYNGLLLTAATASVYTLGSTTGSETLDVQVVRRRAGSNANMLSTAITLDDNQYTASDGSVDAANDDLQTGDTISISVTNNYDTTNAQGLAVALTFEPA